jgi:hypothetical protein
MSEFEKDILSSAFPEPDDVPSPLSVEEIDQIIDRAIKPYSTAAFTLSMALIFINTVRNGHNEDDAY